ncbi:acetate/propionate family kinase [Mucilaginibacter antarcticus]|uniref:Acetate kinase n=1 Tax=Mucilaginibacter antarcticus TaxID=1855725 RepID=A0ABW5XRQ3_9SPHI
MKVRSDKYILVINCGSSSLKFSMHHFNDAELKISGTINGIGDRTSFFILEDNQGQETSHKKVNFDNMEGAVEAFIQWLESQPFSVTAIGHRLVQGGPDHRDPEIITTKLLKRLDEFIYLAPNHLPGELKTIKAFQNAFPRIPQVACFDTAFHKPLPLVVKHYPLPKTYQHKGLIKYGFHGLSYAYILQKLVAEDQTTLNKKIIIAHLGNGASMAAVENGKCLDTTMGLSPTGGLVMGTRSGDLDPGVIIFLLKQYHLTITELDDLLSKQSGMKAIAGISDMQELLAKETIKPKAALAIQIFCYHAKKQIGALAAALGGLDLLVFTGGIGANSPVIREHICRDLNFLGIELNQRANNKGQETISLNTSRVSVRCLKTNEELMIAKAVHHVLNHSIKH